ncbi:carboxyltransferase domain-containing protein [Bacillus sp. JCM 19034]|uniref:carboxyltransferase domain-containing protein n=1 Tax=Bacillus sp. JCM 19034 TaxID=1481928 RepID=UPI000785B6E9|nr:carboxyltransferase domain-containing protein [Bacillus sp. JCM 19034]
MDALYSHIEKVSETALLIRISKELNAATHKKVKLITKVLEEARFQWVVEVVPSYACVMVYLNPLLLEKSINAHLIL